MTKFIAPRALALLLAVSAMAAAIPARAAIGVPDAAQKILGTDPMLADTDGDGEGDIADKDPVFAPNPIPQQGAPATIRIVSAKVEDNFDPLTKKDVPDHLEIAVENVGKADQKGLSLYYTFAEVGGTVKEGTFRALKGLTLKAGATTTLHFEAGGLIDFSAASERFRINPNSALYRSKLAKLIDIQVALDGEAPAAISIKKDVGGAETAD